MVLKSKMIEWIKHLKKNKKKNTSNMSASNSWVIFQHFDHQTQNWNYLLQNLLAAEISWGEISKNSPHTEHAANTESNTTQTHIRRHCPETVCYKTNINAFEQSIHLKLCKIM